MTTDIRAIHQEIATMGTNSSSAVRLYDVPASGSSEAADGFGGMIGESARLREAVQKARLLTRVDTPVLLFGETGVGKDLFARAIHDNGPRSHRPFVVLNCGGLPRDLLASELFGYVDGAFTGARRSGHAGKLEAADGGTLFLDEVAEMPLDLQPFLLRALEGGEIYPLGSNKSRRVCFRLLSACNRDLGAEVRAGRFRIDLYYRISVTSLLIPPLRERNGDLPALIDYFSRLVAGRHRVAHKRFTDDLMAAFARYPWPGNLRELRNVVEAMVLLTEGEVVGLPSLPAELALDSTPDRRPSDGATTSRLAEMERDAISGAICSHQGNLTTTARDLRIARSTLYEKVKKYALEPMLQRVRICAG